MMRFRFSRLHRAVLSMGFLLAAGCGGAKETPVGTVEPASSIAPDGSAKDVAAEKPENAAPSAPSPNAPAATESSPPEGVILPDPEEKKAEGPKLP